MRRKTMPKRMWGHALADLGHVGRGVAGARELPCRHGIDWVLSRKQPTLWVRDLVPGAQQLEQMRRKHHVAILATFALLDADHPALAVDIGHLQRHHLGYAQSGPIGHTQGRLVLEPRRRIEEARHLVRTEDDRQLARLMDERGVLDD